MITPSNQVRRFVLAMCLVAGMAAARATETAPPVAFKGFMEAGGKPLFVVAIDGETSGWIGVGQTFHEAKIVNFDRKSSELTIERHGTRQVLFLADGKVKSGAVTPVAPRGAGDTLTIVVSDGNLEELKTRLLAAANDQTKAVRIIAPPNTSSAALKEVLKAAQAAGIQKFSIVARDAYEREQRAKTANP